MTTTQTTLQVTPLLQTNQNTNLLKLIAILSMLVDHIGAALFPELTWMRCIGRLAFPIFCYCMIVGLLYTKNVKRYLLRLGIFALVSQPFYILAFHPHDFWGQLTNWNIFFTLFLSLLAMWGFHRRRWWLFALCFFALSWWNFDYSSNGIILMLIFYCCRNKPLLGVALYVLNYLPTLLWGADLTSPFTFMLGNFAFNGTFCAVLAAPLLFLRWPKPELHIPKWFFYAFYPAHLALIAVIQFVF